MVRSPPSKLQDCIPVITINRRKGIDDVTNMNDEWKCMFGGPEFSSKQLLSSYNP